MPWTREFRLSGSGRLFFVHVISGGGNPEISQGRLREPPITTVRSSGNSDVFGSVGVGGTVNEQWKIRTFTFVLMVRVCLKTLSLFDKNKDLYQVYEIIY